MNLAIKVYAAGYCKDPLSVPFVNPTFECESLFDGISTAQWIIYEDDYVLYHATVRNEKQAPFQQGGYRVLVKVEAAVNPSYPAWLDLSTYQMTKVFVLDEIAKVDDFTAQPLPLAAYRDIQLTWTDIPDAEYLIEREDYSWNGGPGSWDWTPMNDELQWDPSGKAAIDRNAPFGGDNNGTWGTGQGLGHRSSKVKYRIKPIITGCTCDWQEAEGVPPLRTVNLAMWCVRKWGFEPATTWARAGADFDDANAFWHHYGIDFVLPHNISHPNGDYFYDLYIDNDDYFEIPDMDTALDMFDAYYMDDCLNIYYVETYAGSMTLGVCRTYESKALHNNHRVFIILAKYARNKPTGLYTATLAHELGHALARLYDSYKLDPDGGFDNPQNCPGSYLFCDKDSAYPLYDWSWNPGVGGYDYIDLMWWDYPDQAIGNYNLYQSQGYALESFLHDPVFQNNFEPFPE